MTARRNIGAVCRTYNGAGDLANCLDGLFAQEGVDLHVIVVGNASSPENRALMEEIFAARAPGGKVLNAAEAKPETIGETRALFLRNGMNAGFSAGNNIGAHGRRAWLRGGAGRESRRTDRGSLGCGGPCNRAVLGLRHRRCSTGADENPSTELSFTEEMLVPLRMVLSGLGLVPRRGTARISGDSVEKVSGARFIVRTKFLEQIGFFDESVFLYCEESILAAQVHDRKQRIL